MGVTVQLRWFCRSVRDSGFSLSIWLTNGAVDTYCRTPAEKKMHTSDKHHMVWKTIADIYTYKRKCFQKPHEVTENVFTFIIVFFDNRPSMEVKCLRPFVDSITITVQLELFGKSTTIM